MSRRNSLFVYQPRNQRGEPVAPRRRFCHRLRREMRRKGWPVQPGNAPGMMLARSAFPSKRTADVAKPGLLAANVKTFGVISIPNDIRHFSVDIL